ncbi:MAG: WG repeat-containing protein [Planctomycetota bacterium]
MKKSWTVTLLLAVWLAALTARPGAAYAQSRAEANGQSTPRPLTVALVVAPEEGEDWQAIEAQLLAALSKENVQLVERQQLSAVLDELRLAMADVTETGSADALAKLVPADVFVFVEPTDHIEIVRSSGHQGASASGETESVKRTARCSLRVVETRSGLVLGQLTSEPDALVRDTTSAVAVVKRSLATARADASDRRYVAVLGFQSEESGELLKPVARSLKRSLLQGLSKVPDIVLLEREQLALLSDEHVLTGKEADLKGSTVLVLGGVKRAGSDLKVVLHLLRLSDGRSFDANVSISAQDVEGLGEVVLSHLKDALGELARQTGGGDRAAEAAEMRRRVLYLVAQQEWEEATTVAEAMLALDPSKTNLEVMMVKQLMEWPTLPLRPFQEGGLINASMPVWYRFDDLYRLAVGMMETEARLAQMCSKQRQPIVYPSAGWAKFHVRSAEISYWFLPSGRLTSPKATPPDDPLLRHRYNRLAALTRRHYRVKRAYCDALDIAPVCAAWRWRFAAQCAGNDKEFKTIVADSLADARELAARGRGPLAAEMINRLAWTCTLAEARFGKESLGQLWDEFRDSSDARVRAAGIFGAVREDSAGHEAQRLLQSLADDTDMSLTDRLDVLLACSRLVIAGPPAEARAMGAVGGRYRAVREHLARAASVIAFRLIFSKVPPPSEIIADGGPSSPETVACIRELARWGVLAREFETVVDRAEKTGDWRALWAHPAGVEEILWALGHVEARPLAERMQSAMKDARIPAKWAEPARRLGARLAEHARSRDPNRLRISRPARLSEMENEIGLSDPQSPWRGYDIHEIPIEGVPEELSVGKWDNIILDGDQLILIWHGRDRQYFAALPTTGGQLRMLGSIEGRGGNLVPPTSWATQVGERLYVGRTWQSQSHDIYDRIRSGEDEPIPPDWPALLVFEDGQLTKTYAETSGLPDKSIRGLAAMGGKLYFATEYAYPKVRRNGGHGDARDSGGMLDEGSLTAVHRFNSFVCFDPKTETFDVLASSRHVTPRHRLDGGKPHAITGIVTDRKRECLWLRVIELTPNPGQPPRRQGMWRFDPPEGTFERITDSPGAMDWFDEDHLTDISLRVINAAEDRALWWPTTAPWVLPDGSPLVAVWDGWLPPLGRGNSPVFMLGEHVLVGTVLCDPKTDKAYPYPRPLFGLDLGVSLGTSMNREQPETVHHFGARPLRLPGTQGVLIPARSTFRLFRIGPGITNLKVPRLVAPRAVEGASEGRAAVRVIPWGWGYVDSDGQEVITPRYGTAGRFNNGTAWVSLKDERRQGMSVRCHSSDPMTAQVVHDERICTGLREPPLFGRWRLIDRSGRHLTEEIEGLVTEFSEGRAWIRQKDQSGWGCVSPDGRVVVEMDYGAALAFSEGLARARRSGSDGLFGYLDRSGAWAVKPQFASGRSFSEGLAAVAVGDPINHADDEYALVLEPDGAKWGYINRKGQWVFPPQFETAASFHDGVAKVVKEGRVVHIRADMAEVAPSIERTKAPIIPCPFPKESSDEPTTQPGRRQTAPVESGS